MVKVQRRQDGNRGGAGCPRRVRRRKEEGEQRGKGRERDARAIRESATTSGDGSVDPATKVRRVDRKSERVYVFFGVFAVSSAPLVSLLPPRGRIL